MNSDFLKIFGVTHDDLKSILNAALSKGGDYADLFFEYTVSNDLSLRDTEVNSINSSIDYGVGIRVISNERTGYAYSEQTDMKEMMKAAMTAAQIASQEGSKVNIPHNITEFKTKNHYPALTSWESSGISAKKDYLIKLDDLIFSLDKRVVKVMERLSWSESKILFYNSLGTFFTDERPMASLVATCIMQDGTRTENATSTRSFRMGYEFLNDSLISEMGKEVISECSMLFKASQPKGGEMPVVMGAGSSGILLHEAIGHAFEADFNRKNTSIFCDKFGKRICDTNINIVDDGTLDNNRGSLNIDDEGVPGQKTYMVKDGVLNSYLHDRISAGYYKIPPTGNGRRESFRFIPIPRMRATYMENGNGREEDIIKEVKKGIYVDNFSNGQVQIGAGDFTFYVKSGYLIENGKLTSPIKDVNIIGNGPQALADIVAVADNSRIDNGTWTCGKDSQYCPVSCGMPSVLIKKLTVGGIN